MEDKIVYIYALCEPDTEEVRYIGRTLNISKRYSAHICTKVKFFLLKQGKGYPKQQKVKLFLLKQEKGCLNHANIAWFVLKQ